MADEAIPFPGLSSISTADEWRDFFQCLSTIGVVRGVGNELAGSLNSGARTAVIATGRAMINGYMKPVSSSTGTAIPAASAQNRIDRQVLRLDLSASVEADLIKPKVLTGTPGSTSAPALTTTSTVWDLAISKWTSQSNGALTGLVDERRFIGDSGVRQFYSWARPGATVKVLGIELDTGPRIMWADGSSWKYLGEPDTGDTNLPFNSTIFKYDGFGRNLIRKVGTLVNWEISVLVKPGQSFTQTQVDGGAVTVATIPAEFRCDHEIYNPAPISHNRAARLDFEKNGAAILRHINGDLTAGMVIRTSGCYRT